MRSKYILSSALIMKMVMFGMFAADGTVWADEGVTITCPSDYPNIDSNATSENDCWRECITDDVANSMSVVGKNYYGAGADTCAATECVAGWYVKAGLDIGEIIGEEAGANSAYIRNDGMFSEMNYDGKSPKGQEYYGISGPMSFAVDYAGKGMLTGHGRCSTQAGTNNNKTWTDPTIVNNLTDETGAEGAEYCYCQVDGFTPTGGDKVMVTSAPGVYRLSYRSADECASVCALECAYFLRDDYVESLAFRAAVMDATGNIGPGTCEKITYTLNPGEYLPAGGTEPVDCPNGSYCPGAGDVKYDEEKDQGLVACPDGYDNSDSGAKSENDCYKQCTTDDVAGAMTVVGKNYYGSGVDTCDATECIAGWHVKTGLDIGEIIGTDKVNSSYARINNNNFFYEVDASHGQEYYGISGKNSFAVDYEGKGILTGHGRCSTQAGVGIWNGASTPEDVTVVNTLADETGQSGARYCYCQVDGFTPTGGDKVMVTSAPWVFCGDSGSAGACPYVCAEYCATYLRGDDVSYLAFRAAVMNSLPELPATCEAITYTLNPGEYLPAGGEEPVDCPSGSYCPGAGDVKYDEEKDQGLVACPDGYDNSVSGAKSENDCYKPCTTDDVAGAMTVVGKNYYGDGADTCDATECVAGWNVKPGENLADIIGGYSYVNSATIGWNSQYTGSFNEYNRDNLGTKGEEYYGITENNTFALDYGERGMVYGRALCSSKYATTFDELTDETGSSNAIHCYCRFDGYKPVGENKQNVTASWVYISTYGSSCSDNCIYYCGNNSAYSAMLNTEQITFGTCEEIKYTLNPGEYLPAGGTEPVDCPNGSYCPGAGDVKYDEEKDQGLVACPDGYDNSDSGAKSENDCYKPCTTDDVANSMSVTGKNYYGDGADTCSATECVAGWHVKPGLNLAETIGEEAGTNSAYINNTDSFAEADFGGGTKGQEYYGISGKNSFAVDYAGKGILTGHGRCSTQAGVGIWNGASTPEDVTVVNTLADETGQSGARYCYCQVDGFTPTGGDKVIVTSAPWVFRGNSGSADECVSNCAGYCAASLRIDEVDPLAFRAAVMDATGNIGPGTCTEIIYTLNPGEYLPAGGEEPADCPNGSYCPGGAFVRYDEEKDQGLVACPDGYDNSDSGAKSEADCYKPCTTDDVANSMSVTGKNYYGDGYDSCAATQCLADWKLQDLYGIVGDAEGINSAYISTNSSSYGEFVDSTGLDQDYYGISEIGSFAVDYGDTGIITGRGRCSTKSGTNNGDTWTNPTRFKELDDETGVDGARYCYCQVDSYTPVGGLTQVLYDMPWVFKEESGSEIACNDNCTQSCMNDLRFVYTESLAFRSAVFGYASCEEEVYRVNPGDYLPEGEETPSECPSGSFCSGTTGVSSRPDKSQGISECPSEYPYSDAGAKSESQCYRDCTGDDVANAMTVVGRNYYGDGVDTCIATDCVSGWHLKPGINLEELIGSTYEGSNSEYMAGTNSAYINNAGEFIEYDMYDENHGQDYYGISEKNSFAVIYDDDKGMITGRARCSSQSENSVENLPDESGNADATNCYCTIDSYTPVDGTKQNISAPWIKYGSINWYPGACESNCVQNCAAYMREHTHLDFRGKMFEAAYELPVCSVNQININWNLGYGDNNVSTTTCSYTDVIESPTDPVRPGYIFAGWKLVE